jgi:dTDP-4-amino-4,6-dideoxygalactose transaminase
MTELEAGIGRVQLKKLNKFVESRRKVIKRIEEGIRQLGTFQLMPEPENSICTYWYAHMRIIPGTLDLDRETLVNALNAEGVPAILTYRHAFKPEKKWLLNMETFGKSRAPWSYFDREYSYCPENFPNALSAVDSYFRLPVNEAWTLQEADDYVEALAKISKAYSK